MKKSYPYTGPALLHVGYPKTATSFLQKEVFSNPHFNMALPAGNLSRAHLIHWLRTGCYWEFSAQDVRAEMESLEHPIRAEGMIPVWSDETLLGDPIASIYDGPIILDRLASLKKTFKVLITVREQKDICLSLYREFSRRNRHSIQDFIGDTENKKSFLPILRGDYLRYDVAVSKYAEAFGSANVLALPQELLDEDPECFHLQLQNFLGKISKTPETTSMLRVNKGFGCTALTISRMLNHFYVRSPLSNERCLVEKISGKIVSAVDFAAPKSLDKIIENRWKRVINQKYGGSFFLSNKNLQARATVDLKKYGYQIKEDEL